MLLAACKLSLAGIGHEDLLYHWCVLIRLLSQLESRLLLVRLSVIASQIVATTATTVRTLTRRVQLVCDSPNNVFSKNNFNEDF